MADSTMVTIVDIVLGVTFGLLGIAIVSWIVKVAFELSRVDPFRSIFATIFSPAPDRAEVDRTALPVKVTIEGILPILFWLLIFLPMIIFPIILIIFPLLGIPWSYLLPPTP